MDLWLVIKGNWDFFYRFEFMYLVVGFLKFLAKFSNEYDKWLVVIMVMV